MKIAQTRRQAAKALQKSIRKKGIDATIDDLAEAFVQKRPSATVMAESMATLFAVIGVELLSLHKRGLIGPMPSDELH